VCPPTAACPATCQHPLLCAETACTCLPHSSHSGRHQTQMLQPQTTHTTSAFGTRIATGNRCCATQAQAVLLQFTRFCRVPELPTAASLCFQPMHSCLSLASDAWGALAPATCCTGHIYSSAQGVDLPHVQYISCYTCWPLTSGCAGYCSPSADLQTAARLPMSYRPSTTGTTW
jgi:hypothetical protein